jgi:hypothetical protein
MWHCDILAHSGGNVTKNLKHNSTSYVYWTRLERDTSSYNSEVLSFEVTRLVLKC